MASNLYAEVTNDRGSRITRAGNTLLNAKLQTKHGAISISMDQSGQWTLTQWDGPVINSGMFGSNPKVVFMVDGDANGPHLEPIISR